MKVSVVGASGYVGGEALRLLLGHPEVTVGQATSERLRGRRVDTAHPNLRGLTELRFTSAADLAETGALLLTTPHRVTMGLLPTLADRAPVVIDLSGDFRLRDAGEYERYYGVPHSAPGMLGDFVSGCPELTRKTLRDADWISVPGCMAMAAILALAPLAAADLVEPEVQIDALTGSSGSGRAEGLASSHAERSGVMRVFAPTEHRHEAEVRQHTGLAARMTATGVEAVRGVQVVCHARARSALSDQQIRAVYRERYAGEPFVRVVAQRRGIYRYPDPKILLGSNFCDVGFAVGDDGSRLTAIAALDNLVKGGAGAALQCLNIRMGWPERLGLEFPGLHPL
jgi:LysW-gamma-L-alpha-aminoadipyl-6-phosphate/LysW-L-glutamyl-5-phosphate reductase